MEYGGNKQKIAQAMQMGIVDPTAGVLAGMFIDRMRAAKMQEQAPQATVAQQVMGGAPATPPSAPAGGLGAAPQAAPSMAPQMAPPSAAPEAPMGMAEGGIAGIDIPDTMYDEPTNGGFDDGYAGGGLVAFAAGSPGQLRAPTDWGAYIESLARGVNPDLGVTSRMRSAARNKQVGGVPDSYHTIGAARDFVPPQGMSMGQLHAQLKQRFGSGYDVINEGDHVHIEPGAALGRVVRAGTPFDPANVSRLRKAEDRPGAASASAAPAAAPTAGLGGIPQGSLEGMFPGALKDAEEYYTKNMPERKNEGLMLLGDEARKVLDPEAMKKRKDEDKWMTLAEIGFNMAATNSPYLLQAAGAAAAAALPGARAAKKEREAAKREAIRDLAAVEDITYKQAAEKTKFVTDLALTKLGLKKDDLARQTSIWQTVTEQAGAKERTIISTEGEENVARINAGARGTEGVGGATTGQLTDLRSQAKSSIEDALKAMKAAEDNKNYAQFQVAAENYRNALIAYNDTSKGLGLPGMAAVQMSQFPDMHQEFRKRKAAPQAAARPADTGFKIISAEPIPQ